MENIMRILANLSKNTDCKASPGFTAKVQRRLSNPDTAADKVLKNQAIYEGIFGEAPPAWWGNFSSVHN